MIHRLALTLFLLMFGFASGAATTPAASSVEFVQKAIDALLAEVGSRPVKAGSAEARNLAETYIGPHLDMESASKRVLGAAWREADSAQQARFVTAFRTLVIRLFASAVPSFSGAKVEVLPHASDTSNKLETVRARAVSASGKQSRIDFKVRQTGDKWSMVDFSIEGISMVATYKAEFASIVQTSGVTGVIDQVEKRSIELEKQNSQ